MQPLEKHSLTYTGTLSQLYKLWIINFLLNIITFGIFSFWGKTRVRRYVVSQFSLNDDRFEYTGTGGELFKAFLLATVFFILISIPLFFSFSTFVSFKAAHEAEFQQLAEIQTELADKNISETKHTALKEQEEKISGEINYAFLTTQTGTVALFALYFIIYVFYLPSLSKYGMLIYQMGHLRWRGIRGHQVGSPFLFPFFKWVHVFLSIVTLSLWLPLADGFLTKYKLNRLYFGSQKGEHHPDFNVLFKSHMLTLILAIFTLGLSRIWYHASLARMHVNDFNLGPMRFETDIKGTDLFWLKIVNALILVFTLGLGYPIVLQRNMRFMAEHTFILGDLNTFAVKQATGHKPTFGEGVSHWIDLGARFGTGYLIPYF